MGKKFWSLATLAASLLSGAAIAQTNMQASNPPSDNSWMNDWMNGGAWYLGAKAGGNWLTEGTKLHSYNPAEYGVASHDDGYVGAIQGGYALNNGLRLELEGSTRYNQVNGVSNYGAGRGVVRNYAAMVNAIYAIPLGEPFKPYFGVGVGASDYSLDHVRGDGMPYPSYFSGDRWGLSYQAIAGVEYELTQNIALSLEYRYFSHAENNPTGVQSNYAAHSALVGVRYSFGEPAQQETMQSAVYVPPPAPPPLPPAAPRNYLVFFDFNKSDLTGDARQIVDKAAQNAKTANVTQLQVTGYTDTVGSDAYNMRLSRRRAESVASEMEAQGVPENEIAIYAKGKHDLLVPTGDGVREPQNRRVQIVYSTGGAGPSS